MSYICTYLTSLFYVYLNIYRQKVDTLLKPLANPEKCQILVFVLGFKSLSITNHSSSSPCVFGH